MSPSQFKESNEKKLMSGIREVTGGIISYEKNKSIHGTISESDSCFDGLHFSTY
jgi:hypothetical protein